MREYRRWLVGALFGLASCYSWIGRYPDGIRTGAKAPYVDWAGRRHWFVDVKLLDVPVRETYADELADCKPVTLAITPRDQLRAMDRPGQPRAILESDVDVERSDLVFRVGFVSDVHIRQPSVKLFNDKVSRFGDNLINSFERNGYEEAFSNAAYAAIVDAFNQLGGQDGVRGSRDNKPRLVINTGDATDAGTIQEAYDFVAISHHLRYPMLYALGNHDDAIFGNYKKWIGYTKDSGPAFYPVGERVRFLKFFNRDRDIAGFSDSLVPLPDNFPDGPLNARWAALDLPRELDEHVEAAKPANSCAAAGSCRIKTRCNGFDLNQPLSDKRSKELCDNYPGYYAVTVPGDRAGTTVQLISLNTTRERCWGQDADFPQEQREWLQRELQNPATVTIVFMHHRPQQVPGLMKLLDGAAATRPLVALSAHDHSSTTAWLGQFWELNTGSVEEFPQWARLLEIRRARDNGRLYLSSRILRPQLPLREDPHVVIGGKPAPGLDYWDQLPPENLPEMEAWFEQQFERCDAIAALDPKQCAPGERCNPLRCNKGAGPLLVESAQCAYLGALYDHLFPARGQTGIAAAAQVQVTLDISPQ